MVKTTSVLSQWIAASEITARKEQELEEARKKMDAFLASEFDDQKDLGNEARDVDEQLKKLRDTIGEVQGRTAQGRVVEVFKLVFKNMRSRTHVIASGEIGNNKVVVTIGKNGFGTRRYGATRSRDVDWISDINAIVSMRQQVAKGLVDLKLFDEARKFNRFCENMPELSEDGKIPLQWTVNANVRFASRYGLPRAYSVFDIAPTGYSGYGVKFHENNDSMNFNDVGDRPQSAMVYSQIREAVLAKLAELKVQVPEQCKEMKERMKKFEQAFSRELMLEAL